MKKEYVYVTETVEVLRPKYIAEDGSEFDSENECLTYERDLARGSFGKRRDGLEYEDADLYAPPCCAWDWDDDCSEVRWFHAETKQDFESIVKAYELIDEKRVVASSGDDVDKDDFDYPLTFCVFVWDVNNSESVTIYTLEEAVDSARDNLRTFEQVNAALSTDNSTLDPDAVKRLLHDHVEDVFFECQGAVNASGDIDPMRDMMLEELEEQLACLITGVVMDARRAED